MSIVHLNQIKTHLLGKYKDHVDLTDVGGSCSNIENFTLSRCLSAFAVNSVCDCGIERSGRSVTDSGNDNGIDAILVDSSSSTIYVVQSKWIHSGKGEPSNGDVKKFIAGIRDILNCNFSRFNDKVRANEGDLMRVMGSPKSKLVGILAYTGVNNLALPSRRDIDDLLAEVNDVSSYLTFKVFGQSELYGFLSRTVDGAPINIDIGLKNWGAVKEPSQAFYGQVNGEELKSWWDEFGASLLTKNIRSSLGDTEVNYEISQTIMVSPEKFWYFNNGITLVASKVSKTLLGGGDRDYGSFHCENVSVVNGAQTLSTIASVDTISSAHLSKVLVPLRIISLENSSEVFGEKITKSNNLQNRIESRDFVSLDPEQQRLKLELSMEGLAYSIKRDSDFIVNETSFDLSDSTTALACSSGDIGIIVQLKREVGRIWEDVTRSPYTSLFNSGLSSTYLYRCVLINREIDKSINNILENIATDSNSRGVGVHGNRMIAGLVFATLSNKVLKDPAKDFDHYLQGINIDELTATAFRKLSEAVSEIFGSTVLPTLFKNKNKCQKLFNHCLDEGVGGSKCEEGGEKQMELLLP